ncbi:Avirulence protein [Phytophthora megakarya]|uniref:Avirulence protein n=1 Tax=Phytophthora megakarya TaxID=4795 RepID=A0A225VLL0_9STRA|nr:Avirulence protein [Phytophthora megakarya]
MLLVSGNGGSISTDDKLSTIIRVNKARFLRKHIMEEDGRDHHENFDEERGNALKAKKRESVTLKYLNEYDKDLKQTVMNPIMEHTIWTWTHYDVDPLTVAKRLKTSNLNKHSDEWQAWTIFARQYLRWLSKSS